MNYTGVQSLQRRNAGRHYEHQGARIQGLYQNEISQSYLSTKIGGPISLTQFNKETKTMQHKTFLQCERTSIGNQLKCIIMLIIL